MNLDQLRRREKANTNEPWVIFPDVAKAAGDKAKASGEKDKVAELREGLLKSKVESCKFERNAQGETIGKIKTGQAQDRHTSRRSLQR